jgi:hypothetical protein
LFNANPTRVDNLQTAGLGATVADDLVVDRFWDNDPRVQTLQQMKRSDARQMDERASVADDDLIHRTLSEIVSFDIVNEVLKTIVHCLTPLCEERMKLELTDP